MQYKVPQNIDMEDKIVGPFTMKQFIYLLISGGIIYGWWSYLQNNYVDFMPIFLVVAIPLGLLGVSLALVKINDRPFEVFLLSLFQFISTPKQRMWREGYKSEPIIIKDQAEVQTADNKPKDTRSLDDLSKSLEKQAQLISQKTPTKSAPIKEGEKVSVNVSVKDTQSAQQKQSQAQGSQNTKTVENTNKAPEPNPAPKKKGFWGF